MTGEIITLAALLVASALVIWAVFRPPRPPRAIRRAHRNAVLTGQLPKTNGQGTKRRNRRIWRGKTRKARPAPPGANGQYRGME
jgi:hypothetical protein